MPLTAFFPDCGTTALFTDKTPQSVVWAGDEKEEKKPNRSAIRRYIKSPSTLEWQPFPGEPEINSIWDAFCRGATKCPENRCLGTRVYALTDGKYQRADEKAMPTRGDYVFWTYTEVREAAAAFGAGLSSLGIKANDAVSIYRCVPPLPGFMRHFVFF